MPKEIKPAEAFPPGEYLRDELQARGWTQSKFALIIVRPLQLVSEIINGRKRITETTARPPCRPTLTVSISAVAPAFLCT